MKGAARCAADGTEKDDGAYLKVKCAAQCADVQGHNAVVLRARFRPMGGAWNGYVTLLPGAEQLLGGGLDSTGRSCDNGSCKIYNLDFPDVIAVRNELLPAGEREENIPCDLNNTEWFRKIDSSNGAVFFSSGVFYYFLTEQVKALVQQMADAFPGGVLVFDAANRAAVKMIAKTWLKSAKIRDVGAYFAVSDAPKEIGAWDSRLQVSSRGYMLGYTDLKDPSVSGFFRFLARVGDGMMKMQIVKVGFGGRK